MMASRYQKTPNSKHLQIKIRNKGNVHQSGTIHLGHPVIKRHPIWSVYNSQTRNKDNSKLLERIMVIVFNVPFPYIYHSPKFSKIRGATLLAGYHPIHQIWACAHLFGTLIYSICMISSIFDGNTWSKNFQNTKPFLHSLKSANNKYTFFELTSSWSVHQHPIRERLHSGRETWLSTT